MMSRRILILAVILFAIFSTSTSMARQPTKQPPIAVFNNGDVELSADFIEYLIEVKEFRTQYEISRTIRYNFPEIQRYARDFLKEGPQKTAQVKQQQMAAAKKRWALEREAEEKAINARFLGVTGREFLALFDEVPQYYFSNNKGRQQQEYLEFLEKRIIEKNTSHKTINNKSMFCCKPGFFQTTHERTASTVKRMLKKYGFLKKEDFLTGSAASIIQQILIEEFPCESS